MCLRIQDEPVSCSGAGSACAKEIRSAPSDIIRSSHLTLYPSMLFGVPGLKRTFSGLFVSVLGVSVLLSCSGYNSNTNTNRSSRIAHRALVSNPVFPGATGSGLPVLQVIDDAKDLLVPFAFIPLQSLGTGTNSAGMMFVSPKHDRTLVFSPSDNKLAIINNESESVSNSIQLPAATESMFFANDNTSVFVALPAAAVSGRPAGEVLRLDVVSQTTTATIPIPAAHFLVPSPNGNLALVFSDNSDSITLLNPSLIGTSPGTGTSSPCSSTQAAVCQIPVAFDRPVSAVFDQSGSTAYILNCGPQCGGGGVGSCLTFTLCTSVSILDMTQNPPALVNTVPVPAATIGLLQGTSLYIAGTPKLSPDNDCSGVTSTTAATTCGRLTVINTASHAASSVTITDGYHDRMQLSFNGQLYIGSHNCTNINQPITNSGSEVRGCLSIADTSSGSVANSAVIFPPDNGDVTGMQAITNRNAVYVCEGGKLRFYDTTTNQLETNPAQPNVIGQAVDVKMIDF